MLDETSRQRLERRIQKLTNATQQSFSERALLHEQNQFLAEINNEAKVRRSTKSLVIGKARVISYEDLEKARAERVAKDLAKVAARVAKEQKNAKKSATATPATDEAEAEKPRRGRKRKGRAEGDMPEPKAKMVRTGGTEALEGEQEAGTPEPWRAPVARMW